MGIFAAQEQSEVAEIQNDMEKESWSSIILRRFYSLDDQTDSRKELLDGLQIEKHC